MKANKNGLRFGDTCPNFYSRERDEEGNVHGPNFSMTSEGLDQASMHYGTSFQTAC